jgi:tripartite-type tricarboxylate transporter receptor subunit TctC
LPVRASPAQIQPITLTGDLMSNITRRQLLAAGAAAGFAPTLALAEDFPSHPIRLMLGTTPGGSIDYGARVISPPVGELLHTTIVVENKPGAAGVLCTDYVIKAPADGYTLLMGTPSPIIIAPQAMASVKFNPLTDLTAINMVSTAPLAIAVNPNLGVSNLKELVALSKKRPIRMGLPLPGSVSHLVVEMTAKATGCEFLNVPYKGAAPAFSDAMAGHIDATVSDVGVFLPMHQEKKLRIVMVTSDKRIEQLPDVPTASEYAPGLVVTNWLGVFAPANTPVAVIQRVNDALVKAVARDEVKASFRKASATATAMPSTEQFQKFVAEEYRRYGALVRERHIVIG